MHCQTVALSDFSRFRLSGCLTEEDSFVPAVHLLHEGLGPTWLNANRRYLRITQPLWFNVEDTTAYAGKDLQLT